MTDTTVNLEKCNFRLLRADAQFGKGTIGALEIVSATMSRSVPNGIDTIILKEKRGSDD